jgi:hypothetical protein
MKLCSLNWEIDIYFYNKFIYMKTSYASKSECVSEENESLYIYMCICVYVFFFSLLDHDIYTQQEYVYLKIMSKKF